MLEARSIITRMFFFTAVFAQALAFTGAMRPGTVAGQAAAENPGRLGPGVSAMASVPFTIKQGQTARFELKNKGDEPVAAQLQFVDKEGKVLLQRDATIGPGGDIGLEFPFVGGSAGMKPNGDEKLQDANPKGLGGDHPVELRAQFGTKEAKLIGLLEPALRIVENGSGETIRLIGSEDFKRVAIVDVPLSFSSPPPKRESSIPSDGTAASLTTDLIAIRQGQTARLELKNQGPKPVVVRLQFVDKDGKVVTQRDATITPDNAETLEFTGPNNPLGVAGETAAANPKRLGGDVTSKRSVELRAQFGTEERLIGFLWFELRIVDNGSEKTIQSIGPEGFKRVEQLGPARRPLNNEPAGQGFPIGFTTVAFGNNPVDAVPANAIVPQGAALRLTLRNKSDDPVLVRLQFVGKDGEVLVCKDTTIQPGKDASLEFKTNGWVPGKDNREQTVQAQFGTNNKSSIGGLDPSCDPSLEIVDNQTGSIVKTIGPEGFKEFNPNFHPPLKSVVDGGCQPVGKTN